MSEHTPTPWRFANTIYVRDNGCPAVVDHLNLVICDMIDDGRDEDECRANADFIVKAVNNHAPLIEALVRAREAVNAIVLSTRSISFDADLRAIDMALDGAGVTLSGVGHVQVSGGEQ